MSSHCWNTMLRVSSIILLLANYYCLGQIVINEIFPAPEANQTEWIELYNPYDSNFIIDGFYITNRNSSVYVPQKLVVNGKSFAVICQDTTNLTNEVSCFLSQTKIPTLHNDYDVITIRDGDSLLIDSIYYDFRWGEKGASLERYDWSEPATDSHNWHISGTQERHSVCQQNNQTIKDASIGLFYGLSDNLIVVDLLNSGRLPLTEVNIKCELVAEENGEELQILIFMEEIEAFPKEANRHYEYNIAYLLESLKYDFLRALHIYVSFDSLGTLVEKDFVIELNLPKPFSGLCINEFMYDVEKGCGEFIELFNNTNDTLNLYGWKIFNRPSENRTTLVEIGDSSKIILPKGYFLIIWDSAFFNCFEYLRGDSRIFYSEKSFGLKNGGDNIVVYDRIGICQDSLTFLPTWHKGNISNTKNRSLEKEISTFISSDSSNWFTCVDVRGGTPNETNSVSIKGGEEISVVVEPNPFSPNSVTKPKAKIRYVLPFKQARISGKVMDLNGTIVSELINNELSPSIGEIEWDGLDFNNNKVSPGGYVLLFESVDIVSNKVSRIKKVIAVGW